MSHPDIKREECDTDTDSDIEREKEAGFEIRSAQGAQSAHVLFWELSSPK